ncbi:MAG: DUF6513 domain-containing protein [Planctomycetota bacterium]
MTSKLTLSSESHVVFVTGKLAEQAVRQSVERLSSEYGFRYTVEVLPITVAALITPKWLMRKLKPPKEASHLVLPGFLEVGREVLSDHFTQEVVIGPKDCRDMEELFGKSRRPIDLSRYDIEIIAEINHAPRFELEELIRLAQRLQRDGADRIDIGCDPATRFEAIAECVQELVFLGIEVSVDTFDPWEAATATAAGASLVLSVNSSNRERAIEWGTEVVAIPDTPTDLKSLDQTVEFLSRNGVPFRIDPILEPIGAGLAPSLVRYASVRERYPDAEMMMGIGNLTELTDVDSAGVNMLLIGICQELEIRSVLTTEVINWARSSVRECDRARRLAYSAVSRSVPPKNMSGDLVMLRDRKLKPHASGTLEALAGSIKDNNYRLFAQEDEIHVLSRALHLASRDPFELFDRLLQEPISDNIDRGHAFYLGYEMAKASIALALGKQYEQDQALDWGMLTQEEDLHRIARTSRHRDQKESPP